MSDLSTPASPPSPGAMRQRRYRERQRQGTLMLPAIRIRVTAVERLIRAGLLDSADRGNRRALARAVIEAANLGLAVMLTAGVTRYFSYETRGVAKYEGGDRRLDVLEYLDIARAIGFDPCEPLRLLHIDASS